MRSRFLFASAVVVLVGVAFACGGGSKSPATNPTSPTSVTGAVGSGTLRVLLKDTPFSEAKAVLVTFSEVSVHASGGGWKTVAFADTAATSRTCDLKQLQAAGAQDILGTVALDAGHYTQIRLVVSEAKIYFNQAAPAGPCASTIAMPAPGPNDKVAILDVPPGQVILNREFDLAASATLNMLLDFDGDKSIIETGKGKYKMQPVIGIVSVQ